MLMKKFFLSVVLLISCAAVGAQNKFSLSELAGMVGQSCDSLKLIQRFGAVERLKVDTTSYYLPDSLFYFKKVAMEHPLPIKNWSVNLRGGEVKRICLELALDPLKEKQHYNFLVGQVFKDVDSDVYTRRMGDKFDVHIYSIFDRDSGSKSISIWKEYTPDQVLAVVILSGKDYEVRDIYNSIVNENARPQKMVDASLVDRWKLYPTTNIYNSLLLDTCTGAITIVQWSLESDTEFKVKLCDSLLWESDDSSIIGRFELYATPNMYQFVMINTINGDAYHVQWGTDSGHRWIRKIY